MIKRFNENNYTEIIYDEISDRIHSLFLSIESSLALDSQESNWNVVESSKKIVLKKNVGQSLLKIKISNLLTLVEIIFIFFS